MMKYTTTSDYSGMVSVTIFVNGLVMIAERSHPRFNEITAKIASLRQAGHLINVPEDEQTDLQSLFSLKVAIEQQFALTNRISLKGESLFFDGKEMEGVLVDHVVRAIKQNQPRDSYMPFINFWERVQANPTEHSRENLLRWLMAGDFTITENGTIVGYKGLRKDLRAIHEGPGVVNGKDQPADGHLDNRPGNVVEVARGYVTHDPRVGCAEGLHVGTWNYAKGFGQKVVEVHVDPVDVVSVPTDSHDQKMRVCKYTVQRVLDEGYSLAVLTPDKVSTYEDDDEWECPECGEAATSGGCSEDGCVNYCYNCDNLYEECVCDICPDCEEDLHECECHDDKDDNR